MDEGENRKERNKDRDRQAAKEADSRNRLQHRQTLKDHVQIE